MDNQELAYRVERLEALLAQQALETDKTRLFLRGVPDGSVSLEALRKYAFVAGKDNAYLAGNAVWDGTNYNRIDTAAAAFVVAADGANKRLILRQANAGANPIVWSDTFITPDGSGNLPRGAWQAVNAAGGAAPAYSTNWSNKGGTYQTLRFRALGDYGVHVVGVATKSAAVTAGETIVTLPAGFRPAKDVPIPILSLTAGVVVSAAFGVVTSGGALQIYGGDANFVGINAIFYVD